MMERLDGWLRTNKADLICFLVMGWFLGGPGCVFEMSPTACRIYYAVDDFFDYRPTSRIETRLLRESDTTGEDSEDDPDE